MKKLISTLFCIFFSAALLRATTVKEPYYMIDFSVSACLFEIRVNDVPILSLNVNGQLGTIYPMNTAILQSGEQQVSYTILPLEGETELDENAKFSATVVLYDVGGDHFEIVEALTEFATPYGVTGTAYTDEASFVAEVPYTLNAWQNSQDLTEIADLRALVDATYQKIEAMLSKGEYDQFAAFIRERENNVATCLYLSDEESEDRITELIEELATGYELLPVSSEDAMVLYGHGKLVSLRKPDGDSALQFIHPESGDEISLDMMLHLKKGEKELSVI